MNGTKLVVNASYSSLLLAANARARCVFVHVAVSVRLPSPRALRRNVYINQSVGSVAAVFKNTGVCRSLVVYLFEFALLIICVTCYVKRR